MAKINKSVLKALVDEFDKAAFRAEASVGVVIIEAAQRFPEIAVSDEDWDKQSEETKTAIIEEVRQALRSIG